MPLEDSTTIDAVLPPDDNGRICLVIMDTGATSDPDGRRQLLSAKIQTYAHEIWSGGFIHDHPGKLAGDFIIKVVCRQPPTAAMQETTSVGELGHQIPVVFELETPEIPVDAGADAASEPEYLWSDVLARAFAEFTSDQKFFAMQAEMLTAALAAAGLMNFVFGRAYRADGIAGEIVSVSQEQPTDETAGPATVAKARALGQQLGLEFEYWFVIYTTVRETEEPEEPQLWVVAEGWKRGQNRGISIGQIFQRGDPPHPVGEAQLIGIVPVDVFTAPVAPVPPLPAKPVKPLSRPAFRRREMVALLIILGIAAVGCFAYQKYPEWWRTDKSAPLNSAVTALPPTNSEATPAPTVAADVTTLITVQSAEFAAGKHTADVTARVQELLQDQPDGFKADAKTLGIDPLPGKRKHLTIQYRYQGTNYTFNFPAAKKLSVQTLIDRAQSSE